MTKDYRSKNKDREGDPYPARSPSAPSSGFRGHTFISTGAAEILAACQLPFYDGDQPHTELLEKGKADAVSDAVSRYVPEESRSGRSEVFAGRRANPVRVGFAGAWRLSPGADELFQFREKFRKVDRDWRSFEGFFGDESAAVRRAIEHLAVLGIEDPDVLHSHG